MARRDPDATLAQLAERNRLRSEMQRFSESKILRAKQRREEKVAEGPYENLWVGQCLLQRWADISGKDRVEQAEDGVLARGIAFHGRRRDPLCSRQHGAH